METIYYRNRTNKSGEIITSISKTYTKRGSKVDRIPEEIKDEIRRLHEMTVQTQTICKKYNLSYYVVKKILSS